MTTTLSALETAYLHVDRPGAPIHVGAVGTLEAGPLLDGSGALRLDDIRAHVGRRLALLPKLRQRVERPPLDLGRPRWVEADGFDVADHADAVDIGPGAGDAELRAVAERLFATPLDTSKPLWHVRFVTGLDGGRVGVVQRVHHAAVDGVSGVDVAAALFDLGPEPATEPTLASPPAPAHGRLGVGDVLRGVGHLLGGAGLLAPRSSLNAAIGDERAHLWVRGELDAVRRVAKDAGVTVNDVVLSAVAGGVRQLLLDRGEPISTRATIRVLVPVSLRQAHERGTLGNRVAALLVDLPIGIGDPWRRLRAVNAETTACKASGEAAVSDALLALTDLLPPVALRAAGALVGHQPLVNLVVTNVPGSPLPLYLLGARLLEVFPFVPLTGNLSLGVAVLSYDEAINLGVSADRSTCSDAAAFVTGVEDGFAELGAVPEGPVGDGTKVPAAMGLAPAPSKQWLPHGSRCWRSGAPQEPEEGPP